MSGDTSDTDTVTTHYSLQTQHTACSVEHCHHPEHGHLIAVGTYQLDQDTGQRHGQIILVSMSLSGEGEPVFSSTIALADSCGVLDMKWSSGHHASGSAPVLGVAESSGHLSLYSVNSDLTLLSLVSRTLVIDSGLSLALEWSHDNASIIVSDSGGNVTLWSLVYVL